MASSKKTMWTLLGGVATGAAALYFFDRESGQQNRKAFVRKAQHLGREIAKGAELAARDVEHRVEGMVRHAWASAVRRPVDDRIQVERVRARLGRLVEQPHKIHVTSDDGVITLWGEATEHDARRLAHAIAAMPGIRGVHT